MSLMAVRIHDFWAKLWRPVRWNHGWLMGVGCVGFLGFFLVKNTKKQHERTEHQKRRSSESSFPIGVDRLFLSESKCSRCTPIYICMHEKFPRFCVTFMFRMLKGEEVFFASLSASRAAP